MEPLQSYLPLLFPFFLSLCIIVRSCKISGPHLPPGPRKLPIIGNLHQVITRSLPHHSLKDLAEKHGPLMHLQLGEVPALIVSSARAAREVLKNQDLTFADRPKILAVEVTTYNCSDIAFSPYGEYWRQLRKICTMELLSMKRVQSFSSIRIEEGENLIKSISSCIEGPINLSTMVSSFTNNVSWRAAFGKKCDEEDQLMLAAKGLVRSAGGFDLPDIFPSYKFLRWISSKNTQIEKSHITLDGILNNIIDHHQERKKGRTSSIEEDYGGKDLVDVLLDLQESSHLEFPITMNNIKAVLLDILLAGTDTPSATLEWAMSELIKNPKCMEKVQAEVRSILKGKSIVSEIDIQHMNYLKLVIKETLRLHPPVPLLLPREAREECKIDGYDIPIKTKVIVNAWAIGRDPEYWANPECFDPSRFNDSSIDFKGAHFEYIPFGAGRRMCPGVSLGMANVELPLAQLLYHFNWKSPNGTNLEELDMTEAFGITIRRKNNLILIATPYCP